MMYYLGFLKYSPKHAVIFRSIKTPQPGDFRYFVHVMGPYESEDKARAGLNRIKGYGYRENPVSTLESRAKYCRRIQVKKEVIGCVKGQYHSGKRGVRTKSQAKKYMSDSQALVLTKKIIGLAKRLFKHELSEIRQGNPPSEYVEKFVQQLKTLERYAVGSKPYIDTLAKAYEHLQKAKKK